MITIRARYQNLRCKICQSATTVLGVCDFNKTCEEEKKKKIFPFIGVPIYYHQCTNCQFIFTVDLDSWIIDDYLDNIYNNEYIKADPSYTNERPEFCYRWFSPMLNNDRSISILDYGAGNNRFREILHKQGYQAESWDPMWKKEITFDADKKFDVITAFEVFEHTPTPWETMKQVIDFLNPEHGSIVFSTLINDIIGQEGSNYWYLAPRNGHVCMHSSKSLAYMFDKLGMELQSFSPSQHIASWK